jgi:Fur family peroxide stress response transcriptional regulator
MDTTCKQFRKRNAILSCLRQSHEHPSAETIHAALNAEYPDISLATVYRNLALFKKQGLIASLGTVNGIERFDGNTDPHVHFICTGCDAVIDLQEMQVPQALCAQASAGVGGIAKSCSLTFTGRCGSCMAK